MAFISVTYTFSNGTTADASQVSQNFTDLVNGLSDASKDISVNAGTFAGNVSISGNTTIGNASSDDLTVTASLASSIPIKTTNTYNIGSSTLGLASVYLGANSQTVRLLGSASMSATWTFTFPVTAGTSGYFLTTNGSGVTAWTQTLPIANGGTNGSATPTAGGIVYGTGSAYAVTSAGNSGQLVLSGGAGSPTFLTQSSGTWTPSGTNVSNMAASSGGYGTYVRYGSFVIFAFTLTISQTAANTATTLRVNIPVASDFTAVTDASGAGTNGEGSINGTTCRIAADTTNNDLSVTMRADTTGSQLYSFSGMYVIQ